MGLKCAKCGGLIGQDKGPPDGWQLDDGRTVCHACCIADTKRVVELTKQISEAMLMEGLPSITKH